jgi:hypothetical protein
VNAPGSHLYRLTWQRWRGISGGTPAPRLSPLYPGLGVNDPGSADIMAAETGLKARLSTGPGGWSGSNPFGTDTGLRPVRAPTESMTIIVATRGVGVAGVGREQMIMEQGGGAPAPASPLGARAFCV